MKDHIIVFPYKETSRLFTASATKDQESYLGYAGMIRYSEYEAERFTEEDAARKITELGRGFSRKTEKIIPNNGNCLAAILHEKGLLKDGMTAEDISVIA